MFICVFFTFPSLVSCKSSSDSSSPCRFLIRVIPRYMIKKQPLHSVQGPHLFVSFSCALITTYLLIFLSLTLLTLNFFSPHPAGFLHHANSLLGPHLGLLSLLAPHLCYSSLPNASSRPCLILALLALKFSVSSAFLLLTLLNPHPSFLNLTLLDVRRPWSSLCCLLTSLSQQLAPHL
jgi:hypothetical protein